MKNNMTKHEQFLMRDNGSERTAACAEIPVALTLSLWSSAKERMKLREQNLPHEQRTRFKASFIATLAALYISFLPDSP